jgi:hypothetical protein
MRIWIWKFGEGRNNYNFYVIKRDEFDIKH